jgi:superfamily II DNA or RNA helicase
MRRLFSHRQRHQLYLRADGRCERCGDPLDHGWHAHHTQRHADGGVTEIYNATALCIECHRDIHMKHKPHDWQRKALEVFQKHTEKFFLLNACPGAGKTRFAGSAFNDLRSKGVVDFAVVVVPGVDIPDNYLKSLHDDFNIQLTSTVNAGATAPKEFDGVAVTYQSLRFIKETLRTWARHGKKMMVIFDEIHHMGGNYWARDGEDIAEHAVAVLGMTGTPFRNDTNPISFVSFDIETRECICHFNYHYGEGVTDRVCKDVEFVFVDGESSWATKDSNGDEQLNTLQLSDASAGITDRDRNRALRIATDAEANWLHGAVTSADAMLKGYRETNMRAACLVVCRPGNSDGDIKHLHKVARAVRKLTNYEVREVSYSDPASSGAISSFRNDFSQRYIAAVRKISEGVDIPRLAVMVMATAPSSFLLFMQLIGRVIRMDHAGGGTLIDKATVYLPRTPELEQWAKRIEEEVQVFSRVKGDPRGADGGASLDDGFAPIGDRSMGTTTIHRGKVIDEDDAALVFMLRVENPALNALTPDVILALYKRGRDGVAPKPPEAPTDSEPLDKRKKRLRTSIGNKVRKLAMRRGDGDKYRVRDEAMDVWKDIHGMCGSRNVKDLFDNYPIEAMERVDAWLDKALGGVTQ